MDGETVHEGIMTKDDEQRNKDSALSFPKATGLSNIIIVSILHLHQRSIPTRNQSDISLTSSIGPCLYTNQPTKNEKKEALRSTQHSSPWLITPAKMNTPFTFPCGMQVSNRICKPAMSESLALRSGCPSEELIHLYEVWGRDGGAGLIITGNIMIDHRRLTEPRNAILEDERHLSEFTRMAKACKCNGSVAIVQVSHPGKVGTIPLTGTPVGPSAVPLDIPLVKLRKPRALTVPEIEDLIQRFARTAELAVKAGFDGAQIHGKRLLCS